MNFFDKFWQPYLEYEAELRFGIQQVKQEVLDLDIENDDLVANIGINWGHSLGFIFKYNALVKGVVGIDNCETMLALSEAVFSEEDKKLNPWLEGLSPRAQNHLKRLHKEAKKHSDKVKFVNSSAENFHQDVLIDKIAATMGYHWLTNPVEAFSSMNKSLKERGVVTFSSASGLYKTNLDEKSFTKNPYYQTFFEIFSGLYGEEKPNVPADKFTRDEVLAVVEAAGFKLDRYREHCMEINEDAIDTNCLAGIKFKYDVEGTDVLETAQEALRLTKEKKRYAQNPQQFEICPIFRIKKVKDL
jgi:SAM-dependent methyltransferase